MTGVRAPFCPSRLSGRRAIVTGGGSGIGRACAIRLAQEGAAVAVLDIRHAAASQAAAEIAALGAQGKALVCDVGDELSGLGRCFVHHRSLTDGRWRADCDLTSSKFETKELPSNAHSQT